MTKEKAFEITKIVIEAYGYDEDVVKEIILGTTISDLDLDSLDLVQISILIEKMLEKDITINSLGGIKTVEDIVKIVELL